MNYIPNCPGGLSDAEVPEMISIGNVTVEGVDYTAWKNVVTEKVTLIDAEGNERPLPEGMELE